MESEELNKLDILGTENVQLASGLNYFLFNIWE